MVVYNFKEFIWLIIITFNSQLVAEFSNGQENEKFYASLYAGLYYESEVCSRLLNLSHYFGLWYLIVSWIINISKHIGWSSFKLLQRIQINRGWHNHASYTRSITSTKLAASFRKSVLSTSVMMCCSGYVGKLYRLSIQLVGIPSFMIAFEVMIPLVGCCLVSLLYRRKYEFMIDF